MVSTGTDPAVLCSSATLVGCCVGSLTGASRSAGAFFAGRGRTAEGVRDAAAAGRGAEGLDLAIFAREALAREVFALGVLPREDFAREVFARDALPFALREAVFEAFFFGRARADEAFFFAVPRFDFAAALLDPVRERDLLFFLAAIFDSPVVST
jgi:hypothetical protein